MEPFPRRSVIVSRHSYHYGIIREQWLLRERELKERESRNRVEKMKKPVSDSDLVENGMTFSLSLSLSLSHCDLECWRDHSGRPRGPVATWCGSVGV